MLVEPNKHKILKSFTKIVNRLTIFSKISLSDVSLVLYTLLNYMNIHITGVSPRLQTLPQSCFMEKKNHHTHTHTHKMYLNTNKH